MRQTVDIVPPSQWERDRDVRRGGKNFAAGVAPRLTGTTPGESGRYVSK